MKKLIGVVIIAALAIGIIAGYSIFSGNLREGASNQGRTVEVAGLRIEIQRTYLFEEWVYIDTGLYGGGQWYFRSKGLAIELKFKNIGDKTEKVGVGQFYIKDARGEFYKRVEFYPYKAGDWDPKNRKLPVWIIGHLSLEPGESGQALLYLMKAQTTLPYDPENPILYDFPENLQGLTLIYKDYTGKILATIPLKVEAAP